MTHGDFSKYLMENPQNVSSLDTVMDNFDSNIKEGGRLLRRNKETYKETDISILFRTGDSHDGYIVLLDKRNNYVNYFARFEYKKLAGSQYVTQVAVWRSVEITLPHKETVLIASEVFFNILLKKFKKIASDQEQTADGQRFWIAQMKRASNEGHKVGLLKVDTKDIDYYDKTKFNTIIDWIATLESSWGNHIRYKRYRFVIEE